MPTPKEAYWGKHVDKWIASGKSCKVYAQQAKVNHHTLSWWRARLGKQQRRSRQQEKFIEVLPAMTLGPSQDAIAIEVRGLTIRVGEGFSQRVLGDVLTVIEGRG